MARKRKFEPEMGSERRNPSRKARPPENFAVEEKSEPVTHRGPRTVDIRRLVEVRPQHPLFSQMLLRSSVKYFVH